MEKLENWFLDRFVPGLMFASQYVGLLTIYFGASYLLNHLLNWKVENTFIALIVGGFVINYIVEDRRLNRIIKNIIDSEKDNIMAVIKDGAVDYSVVNKIELEIKNGLNKAGLYNGDKNNLDQKIKKMIFETNRIMRYKETKKHSK